MISVSVWARRIPAAIYGLGMAVLVTNLLETIRDLGTVSAVNPGFSTENILTVRTALPIPKYEKTKVREQFYTKVLAEVRRLPGVTDAAYISALPMVWRGGMWPVEIDGRSQNRAEGTSASCVTSRRASSQPWPSLFDRDGM